MNTRHHETAPMSPEYLTMNKINNNRRRALGVAMALLVLVAVPAVAADIVGRDAIVGKLAPPADRKVRSLMVMPSIDLDVKFEFNSDKLTDEAVRQLSELGSALSSPQLNAFRFEIAGHTDAVGGAAYNQTLSERRSAAVKSFLVQRHGIDVGRLAAVGWGFKKLKNPQDPASGENRRVEIVNLGN